MNGRALRHTAGFLTLLWRWKARPAALTTQLVAVPIPVVTLVHDSSVITALQSRFRIFISRPGASSMLGVTSVIVPDHKSFLSSPYIHAEVPSGVETWYSPTGEETSSAAERFAVCVAATTAARINAAGTRNRWA